MAVIAINYTEGESESYESVELKYAGSKKEVFNSGDFVKDWWFAIKFLVHNVPEHLSFSSSVDHFISDGAQFDSAWLDVSDEKGPHLVYEYQEEKIEFFVNKGETPTWQGLKDYCEK